MRETNTVITPTTEIPSSVNGDTSHYYNFTADSVFILSPNFNTRAAYTVTSPTQLIMSGLPMQIKTLTNSNCILYGQYNPNVNGSYTTLTIELKK